MSKVNPKRTKILKFIESYFVANCRLPSVREIQSAARLGSTSTVTYHLNALVNDGKLKRIGDGARNFAPAWLPDALRDFYTSKTTQGGVIAQ